MKILTYPTDAKLLRTPVVSVTSEMIASEQFKTNLEQMKEIAKQDGLGLAAPQVGWSVNLFVILVDKMFNKIEPQVIINPKITSVSDSCVLANEGCLSFNDLFLDVLRPREITWQWEDLDKNQFSAVETYNPSKKEGYYIRIIQHECDHLNSVLFVDRISAVGMVSVKRWIKNNKK